MARYIDPGRIPGPVFIPGCVALRLFWTLANQKRAYNVLHASYSTAPPFSTAWVNTLGTAIKGHLTTSGLLNNLDSATKFDNIGIRDMAETTPGSGIGYAEWVSSLSEEAGAAVGGNALPPGCAFVVTLKTGFSRQANRGRVYLPGFNTNALTTGGTIPDDVKQDCIDFVEGIQTALGNVNLTLCIAHPARKAYTGVTGVEYDARDAGTVPVTSIAALNNVFDSQRLRSHV